MWIDLRTHSPPNLIPNHHYPVFLERLYSIYISFTVLDNRGIWEIKVLSFLGIFKIFMRRDYCLSPIHTSTFKNYLGFINYQVSQRNKVTRIISFYTRRLTNRWCRLESLLSLPKQAIWNSLLGSRSLVEKIRKWSVWLLRKQMP